MNPPGLTEDTLVEQPCLDVLRSLGWEVVSGSNEASEPLGRRSKGEVVLTQRLRDAVGLLNSGLSSDVLDSAVDQLVQDRSAMTPVRANSEIYELLRDGALVKSQAADGTVEKVNVRFIDWNVSSNNDWLAVNQFSVKGDLHNRRPDVVLFVNGIPLVFLELKHPSVSVQDAYSENLRDNRDTIPRLFWFNAFVILSNGTDSRMGSTYASWNHFAEWKKIDDESEPGVVSLETMLRGTCQPSRLLDLVENFVVYTNTKDGLIKKVAKNHQYLGVNNAIEALYKAKETDGKLGVFWHTQGSGKSLSMLWFTQKVLRRQPGNWTFVMVTDRSELDDQLYEEFADSNVITSGKHVHAETSQHLRELLVEDNRYVFTLIHKFIPADRNDEMPVLSERDDVIVITDEAHRSQYNTLAANMRKALPNASYLGFTGTPLIDGEAQETRRVFGDYVSTYNFADSIEDGATVQLFYENRIPELQLENENFDDDLDALLEQAQLDQDQEKALSTRFARQYQLITRPKRLEEIAADLVEHFASRGFLGKGMYVAIDKATTVKMFDLVKAEWEKYIQKLETQISEAPEKQASLEYQIKWMRETDMSVIVSQSQNEIDDMAQLGLDIKAHRKRIVSENLDEKFKDPNDPLRLVFVCAMWLTGFDSPSTSTVYLDKPMRGHTLMQTIARANRVFEGKDSGLIVDYIGVFRNLEKALAIYGAKLSQESAAPIVATDSLREEFTELLKESEEFLENHDIDFSDLEIAKGFEFTALQASAVEALLIDEPTRKEFVKLSNLVRKKYRALLPDNLALSSTKKVGIIRLIANGLSTAKDRPDISDVTDSVEKLLDESVGTTEYLINAGAQEALVDLNQIDFDQLALEFAAQPKTAIKVAREVIEKKVEQVGRRNPSYAGLGEKVRQLIDDYNAGTHNAEETLYRLRSVNDGLDDYQDRFVREDMSEEELAIFDLLTKPNPELSDSDLKKVKSAAKKLLEHVTEKLVLDWKKKQQTVSAVRTTIKNVLDQDLPDPYDRDVFVEKCDAVFDHLYTAHSNDGGSVYDEPIKAETAQLLTLEERDKVQTAQTWDTPVEQLISDDESRTLEFKETARWNVREGKKDKTMEDVIAKTVAGFLNTSGGTLLIGVDDGGKLVGLERDLELVKPPTLDGFVNWLDTMLHNKLGYAGRSRARIKVEKVSENYVVRVDVGSASRPIFTDIKGKEQQLFERQSNSTRAVQGNDMDLFISDRFPNWKPNMN